MVRSDKNTKYEMGIGHFSRFIDKYLHDIDWDLIAMCCGVTDILYENNHVIFAQLHRSPKYPRTIAKFLINVFDEDENRGLFLIKKIISQNTLNENAMRELNEILKYFNDEEISVSDIASPFHFFESEKFILLPNYPDNFYKKLIEEINFQYETKHSMSLSVLIRKLFENLIIDILRKKYGAQGVSKYYDTSRGRFYDFSVLLKNMGSNISDFRPISSNLDQKFISELNKYRETGNSGAHSIDVNLTIEEFTANKKRINYSVSLLIRILDQI